MGKARIEAITDGIVAIAATIMVLELGVPKGDSFADLLDQRYTFMAYIISFFMIYITWHAHHYLFQQIEKVSTRTFLVNGVWIFFVTMVPITTAWQGTYPASTAPAFVYALNLLLWSISFHWLDHQARKDNPGIKKDGSLRVFDRSLIYGGYTLCLVMAFIYAQFNLYFIGITAVILIMRMFMVRTKLR